MFRLFQVWLVFLQRVGIWYNTITIYIAGYAVSQLCAGIVSDIYGRKLTTLLSLIVFIAMNVAIIFASSINYVLLFRFIQGFSVGFFAVSQRALIVDLFKDDVKKLHNMMNYVTIAWSIGPIVAPAIGGYLEHIFNWQANFIFLIVYSVIMFMLVCIFVPETLQQKNKFNYGYIKESFNTILSTKNFNLALLCNGALYTATLSFSTIGTFMIESKMGYSPIIFGYCALLLGLCWFVGNILNRMLHNYTLSQKVIVASKGLLVVSILALAISFKFFNIFALVIPMAMYNIFAGFVFSNYFIFNATMFPRFAGNAGSILAGGFLIFAAVGGSILSKIIPTSSTVPLMVAYLILTLLCFAFTRMIRFQCSKQPN